MNKEFFKLGIIGNPLSHSISPVLQKAALSSVSLDGSYEKFEVAKEKIPELLNMFKKENFSGFNVTIPHKIEIIKYLDTLDETAKKIGAVNTVKITDDKKLIGYNTDVLGFFNSIIHFYHSGIIQESVTNAALLGCGGAALAVVFGLEKLGCKNLSVYARNIEKAGDFIKNLEQKTKIKLSAHLLENLNDLKDTDILINATPLGTKGVNENLMAVKKELFSTAKKSMLTYDLVYNPAETLFLKTAKNNGLAAINGLDMLLLQGAKAFEIWTGKIPDIEQMKQAVL